MKDNRKWPRFVFIEDIVVDGSKQCTTSDISEGGLFISTILTFEEDSVVHITIPFKGEKLILEAEVKHCQPGIGFGLKFIDLSNEQKMALASLIENLQH